MGYTPQQWSDNDPTYPASAVRFSYMEGGIKDASDRLAVVEADQAELDALTTGAGRLSETALRAAFGRAQTALTHFSIDPTLAAAARATLVSIPTYEGSGVAVHPSVYFNPDGWGWAGKRYWMAFTPYPSADNQKENPSIVCSDDGNTWVVPTGLTNPVVAPLGAPAYNSDPNLFVDTAGTMYLFWREYLNPGPEEHYFRTSTDGVTWGPKTRARSDDRTVRRIMAPSYFQMPDSTWVMYGVDILPSPNRTLVRCTAPAPTGPWTTPEVCTITGNAAVPWHVDIQRVGGEWHALVMSNVTDGSGGDLWAAVSTDGRNFTAGPTLIPRGTPGLDWDASYYKSCFVPGVKGGRFGWDAWIGGGSFPASGQIIGRTFVYFDDIATRIAAGQKTADILAAKNGLPPWLVGDSFARTDAAGLGNAETGQAWTASTGTFTISGKGAVPSAAANTRALIEGGQADARVYVDIVGPTGTQQWLIGRAVDGSNYYRFGVAADQTLVMQKIVAGAVTVMRVISTTAPASGSELSLRFSGSVITAYVTGAEVARFTDTSVSGTQYGVQAATMEAKFRNFRVSS